IDGIYISIFIAFIFYPLHHIPFSARNDPKTAIVNGSIINGNPRPYERSIPGRNVIFILVPGLTRLSGPFYEKHALHTLQVRTYNSRQHIYNPFMEKEIVDHG